MNALIRIGPPMTKLVVLNWSVPPPPVAVTSTSHTVAPVESAMRAHVAVPVASAAESWVIADMVSVPLADVPHGSENVRVPSKTCATIASAAVVGCVPV